MLLYDATFIHMFTSISSVIAFFNKGGPMFYADSYGLSNILMKLDKYYKMYPGSEYFRPSGLLKKCVDLDMGVQEYYNNGHAQLESNPKSKL